MVARIGSTPRTSIPTEGPFGAGGMKFNTLDQFQKFAKNNGTVTLKPGASFQVFVPMKMGAGVSLRGFNKNSPFTYKTLNQAAPHKNEAGQWLQISAKAGAKIGTHDSLKFVSTPVLAPGTKPAGTTLFNFKMQVTPGIIMNPIMNPHS
jgi:hypothetical protein